METAANERPRFRSDLVAQYIEEAGVQYVDVTDPNSGNTFRFYDVEYSIACAMNGDRDLPGLVEWTRAELGLETSADELATVVNTLSELGYLEVGGVELGPAGATITPQVVGQDEVAPEIELGAPGGAEAAVALATDTATSGGAPEVELGAPGRGEVPFERPAPSGAPEIELGAPGVGMAAAGGNGASTRAAAAAAASEAARPPAPPGSSDDMSFAGLMDDVPSRVGARPEAVAKLDARSEPPAVPSSADITPPPAEPPSEVPLRPTTAKLGGAELDEPTNIPKPMTEPDDEDVSVDLSAHISLDKNEVREAVRQSKVMEVPEIPPDLLEEDRKAAAAEAVSRAESDIDEAATKPAMPLPPPPTTQTMPALPAEEPERLRKPSTPPPTPPTALPERPGVKPIEATKAPRPMEQPKKGASGALFVVILLLVAAAGGVYYWFFMREPASTGTRSGAGPAPTTPTGPVGKDPGQGGTGGGAGQVPVKAGPVVAKLATRAAAATEARAAADGVVAWMAPAGKDVAADEPVVKLQGYTKWENQKAQAAKRLAFYTAELEKAKTADPPNPGAVAGNQKKVEEKQGLISQADDELAKLVVPAPAAGKLEPVAKLGAAVKAGDVVVKVSGGAPAMAATFDVGAAAADYEAPGAACAVAAKGAPDKRAACVVEGVDGGKVTVRLVEGSPFADGDEVELLPAKK